MEYFRHQSIENFMVNLVARFMGRKKALHQLAGKAIKMNDKSCSLNMIQIFYDVVTSIKLRKFWIYSVKPSNSFGVYCNIERATS